MKNWLKPTYCIDHDHPDIRQLAAQWTADRQSPTEKAIALYYAVRDGWRYNPYNISFTKDDLQASVIAKRTDGHCIDKAILLIAFCRAAGIPARLCLASVRNHIATEKFEELLGTNILVPHGYAEVYLKDRWYKLTPAFNQSLCEKLGVDTLEFDGKSDALFQQYNQQGSAFMEYLEEFGCFDEVPVEYMLSLMREYYPRLFSGELDESGIKIGRPESEM